MTRVLVFEYLTGGGLIDGDTDGAAGDELMPMGRAMRDALVADLLRIDGCSVSVAACERAPLAAGSARAVQACAGESVFDFVARQAAQHDLAWIVAPETGGLLAQFHGCVGADRWLGCDRAAIELASSKGATLRRLHDAGLPTPLGITPGAQPTRWVVKPDDGAGCVATRVHASHAAAQQDARSRAEGPTTIEPWVEGEPLSISVLCSNAGAELLSVNRQRIGMSSDGQLTFNGVDVNVIPPTSERGAALSALASRVARAVPGLHGFVGIDLVWHPTRGPVVIELNPRVTCAYVGLSAALGRNLAADVVRAHTREWSDALV
ncbi:ATP-grasp domain-containing protein [Ideonella sp.]|uniref:ATP-grasp domain-containing protein n=1 Tax=Ideonella sp. TaxID=1929293 RepID=UPI002B460C59|nr:ATP-grasp domain-containing protein [Ideonella sp.]HJV72129.1 ATP-grasp domain-containing protein [Ideonella sp.]